MAKLKALRGSIGSYGRVAAGGIVDVDSALAEKLLKSKRFVSASDKDIAEAQAAQKKALAVSTAGAGAPFMPMPDQPAAADRLSQMVESGQISREKAKDLASLQISLSTEEVQDFIKAEADRIFAEVGAAQDALAARETDLSAREEVITATEADLGRRLADLEARERAVAAAEVARTTAKATAEKPADKAEK